MNIRSFGHIIKKIVYIVFFMLVNFLGKDVGSGVFSFGLLFSICVYALLFGDLKDVVAKMVQVRIGRGFYNNAKKILRMSLMYCFIICVILIAIFVFLGSYICNITLNISSLSGTMWPFGILVFLWAVTGCLKGYLHGFEKHIWCSVADGIFCISLMGCSTFVLKYMYSYGTNISALLRNGFYTGLQSAVGAIYALCIAQFCAVVVLLIGMLKCNLGNGGKNIDSFSGFITNYYKIHLSNIEKSMFPCLSIFVFALIFVRLSTKTSLDCNVLFGEYGVLFGKVGTVLIFSFAFWHEYIQQNEKKLRIDLKREEHGNIRNRSNNIILNSFYVFLPLSATLIALAKPIVMIFFGGAMAQGVTILRMCGILALMAAVTTGCKAILRSIGLKTYSLIISGTGFFAGLLLLIPSLKSSANIKTLVYAILIYYIIQFFVGLALVHRMVGLRIFELGEKLIKILISTVFLLMIQLILDKFLVMNIVFLLITLLLSYAVFFISISVLRVYGKREVNSLKGTMIYYPTNIINGYFLRR
ncbi:MAG: hypothetical protein KBT19_04890 [Lachnospiraceae bacterium]|nr:hypothetical protein [Candidatus Colinaster equi]